MRMWKKFKTLCITGGDVKLCSCCEKQWRQALKKLNRITTSSENFIPLYKIIESIPISKRYLYTWIHSSIVHVIQKVGPIQMLVNRCTNKMWYRHIVEYYSALKRSKSLTHVTTWMNLDNVMPSEISQTQRDKQWKLPLIWGAQNSQVHRDRK